MKLTGVLSDIGISDTLWLPPQGFRTLIQKNFDLTKDEILKEARKWMKYAGCRNAVHAGLFNDINTGW